MTGVFCQSAIESAERDADMVIQSLIANKKWHIDQLKKLFKKIDNDESGVITIQEFESHFEDSEVQAFFESLELEPQDAWTLFKLLDLDETFDVDIEEFISGYMRLRGSAKSIDIAKMMYDSKYIRKKLTHVVAHVETHTEAISEIWKVLHMVKRVMVDHAPLPRQAPSRSAHQSRNSRGASLLQGAQ